MKQRGNQIIPRSHPKKIIASLNGNHNGMPPCFVSGVGTRCAWPARLAQSPAITEDITRYDWLNGSFTL